MQSSSDISRDDPDFQLIETMVYRHRIRFFEDHLDRMRLSARVFQIPFNADVIRSKVNDVLDSVESDGTCKIRMTLNLAGKISCEKTEIYPESRTERKLCISPVYVDSANLFFYHKTTRRALYESEYARAVRAGFYDILFLNQHARVTEASRNNVLVKIGGKTYTPPISDGLLGGVYRKNILQRCNKIIEAELSLTDLENATAIYLSNAVRGLRKITAPLALPVLGRTDSKDEK